MFRLLAFLLTLTRISAQSFQSPALLGMGNTAAAHIGMHGPVANPAGIARLQQFSIGAAYQNHYMLTDLNTYGLYTVIPTFSVGALGLNYSQYNSALLLRQTILEISYAYPFAKYWSAAVGLQRRGMRWEEEHFPHVIKMNAGVQYHRNNLSIGMYFKQFSFANSPENALFQPTHELALGANYLFSEQIYLATDLYWEQGERPELRTGLEYRFHRSMRLRGGVSSNPLQYYFGFGVLRSGMYFDIATSIHRELGLSPQIGLAYVF